MSSVDNRSSYRSIFKSTSLFGGVQVFQILVGVIRSKVIAVLLGPSGVGILGLYQSAIVLVQSLTSMGLATSAVRDVSEANSIGDIHGISKIVKVLMRLIWITGIIGLLSVIVFSPILSRTTFGNDDYVIPFIFLSVILLFDQLCAGQKVVLQGMRRLKDLAKASTYGAVVGLFFSIPLYYLLGVEGIVPTLILNSLIAMIFSWYYSKKIKLENIELGLKETIKGGGTMLKMGFAMSLSAIMVYASSYFLRGFIREGGGTEAVGIFTAGFTLLGSYVGMVFSAMTTDYYPRLASVCKDEKKTREIVNEQGEIASLILGPLLMGCLVFMILMIKILYSNSFIQASDYLFWAIIGMMFKLGSWIVAFQVVARGDMKIFITNEIIANLYSFLMSIIGYKIYGLQGLGIAFSLGYFLYEIQIYLVTRYFYKFEFTSSFIRVYLIEMAFVIICMIMIKVTVFSFVTYALGIPMIIVSSMWSISELNKRLSFMSAIKSKFRNKQ